MPLLTPDQFEQLLRILTDAFDKRGIAELARTTLGVDRLDKLVDPDQPTLELVFDFLTWVDKRGMHTLEVVLQGAIGMKPENAALRVFCEHNVPGALKPTDTQVTVLTPDQFEQLQRILTDAFDKRGIAELARTTLGVDQLDKLVDPHQATPGIVFDFLTSVEKRGMHTLEVVLQGAIGMKPENVALRVFCEHNVPGALKSMDTRASVEKVTDGLKRAAYPKAQIAEQQPRVFISYLETKANTKRNGCTTRCRKLCPQNMCSWTSTLCRSALIL